MSRDDIEPSNFVVHPIPGQFGNCYHFESLLSIEFLEEFRSELLKKFSEGKCQRAETPQRRFYKVNDPQSLYIGYKVRPYAEKLVRSPLAVIHIFASLYDENEELIPHLDRDVLPWSLAIYLMDGEDESGLRNLLCLGSSQDPCLIDGKLGDGVLFAGHKTPHWRVPGPAKSRVLTTLIHFKTDFRGKNGSPDALEY